MAATAIGLVVLFGTLMIPLMPLLTGALGLDERTAGLWIGASTHEVAQVVAAGGLVGGAALSPSSSPAW
ncbi:putative membrane protein YadS [Micrococcus endophyticus]|uniref:Putative membrane protein YadS n=1 Tax=Micrococcus endophyticus TaxID=455343 RepID=A0A7W9N1G8_9MICC|nr:putative membrane protein YadS [Micrococcus endophyticus]